MSTVVDELYVSECLVLFLLRKGPLEAPFWCSRTTKDDPTSRSTKRH